MNMVLLFFLYVIVLIGVLWLQIYELTCGYFVKTIYKMLVPTAALLFSNVVMAIEAPFELAIGNGELSVSVSERMGINATYDFKFNGVTFGHRTSVGIEATKFGPVDDGTEFILFESFTGGSGCGSVLAVLTVNNDYLVMSPEIPACGSLKSAELLQGKEMAFVGLKTIARHEDKVSKYAVSGSLVKASEPLKEVHSFFEWYPPIN